MRTVTPYLPGVLSAQTAVPVSGTTRLRRETRAERCSFSPATSVTRSFYDSPSENPQGERCETSHRYPYAELEESSREDSLRECSENLDGFLGETEPGTHPAA